MSRLKKEVEEQKHAFEGKLDALAQERLKGDLAYSYQEIFTIRLFLALLQSVEDHGIREFIVHELGLARTRVQAAEKAHDAFAAETAGYSKELEELVKRDRDLANSFRSNFSSLEQEALVYLQKLFRQRPAKGAPGGGGGAGGDKGAGAEGGAGTAERSNLCSELCPFKVGNLAEDYSAGNLETLHVPHVPEPVETLTYADVPADKDIDPQVGSFRSCFRSRSDDFCCGISGGGDGRGVEFIGENSQWGNSAGHLFQKHGPWQIPH